MINGLVNEYNKSQKFKSTLDNYSLKELMDNLYFPYAHLKFFRDHSNMGEILEYISSYILNNISKYSFLELMSFYTKLLLKIKKLEGQNKSNNNLIERRSDNLQNKFFIENEPKSRGNQFLIKYELELEQFKKDKVLYQKMIELLNKFKNDLLIQMNLYLEQLSNDDRNILLIEFKRKIENNSLEILKRSELGRDKRRVELQSKFNEEPIEEIYKKLDTSYLEEENDVYTSFQGVLNNICKSINK